MWVEWIEGVGYIFEVKDCRCFVVEIGVFFVLFVVDFVCGVVDC